MTDNPISAVDPVAAFEKTLHDLASLIHLFGEDDVLSTEDFMAATREAGQRMKAVCMFTMATMMSSVTHKIDPTERAAFEQRVELEEMSLTPQEQQLRLLESLRQLAQSMTQY